MIYDAKGRLILRGMEEKDAQEITEAERRQGWNACAAKYQKRLADQREGKAVSLVAEYDGRPVGYINVYPGGNGGPFVGKGYPEIVDFGVLESHRRRGIGAALMDAAEKIAASYAGAVYLGVGLHSGYGAAQRMYIKRGYIPDGSGVWYRDKVCEPYKECRNDDDLVLYLVKKLG